MRVSLILIFTLAIITGAGCRKLDRYTIFNKSYDSEVVIPASMAVNLPFNILTPEINSNSEQTFEVNDTRKDLIETIKLKNLTLTISDPPNGNFNFLNSIAIFISADGINETRLAWKDNIPANNSNSLVLDLSGEDFKEYIKKDKFKLRVNTVTDQLIGSDHTIQLHSEFEINAKLINR